MKVKIVDKEGKPYAMAFAPRCKEILVSQHRHDFSACSCGKAFVDGGSAYIRAGGFLEEVTIGGD